MENKVNSKEIQNIKITEDVKLFVKDLVIEVVSDDDSRQVYLDKLVVAYDQRMMNPSEDDIPWTGAPNISIPFTDKIIRKKKPALVSSIWNTRKLSIVNVTDGVEDVSGTFSGKSKLSEKALNFYLRNKVDWLDNLILGVDYMLEKGRCYFKVFEEFNFKFVSRTINVKNFKDKTIVLGDKEVVLDDEGIKALRELDISEVIELLNIFSGFEFSIEDEDHLKVMKNVAEEFKSGKDEIEFQLPIIESRPVIKAIPPEQLIVPADTPRNIQKARRICHEFHMSEKDLLDAVESSQFDKDVVENRIKKNDNKEVLSDVKQRLIETRQKINSGISENEKAGLYRIWEIHTYWKKNDSDRLEKWVFTVFAYDTKGEILRVIREPNDEDIFPFEVIDHEIREDNAYASRGVPEMLRFVQEIIDMQENNRIRRDVLNNTPMFRNNGSNSGLTSSVVQFIPGQVIDQGIEPFNLSSNVDVSSERIEQTIKAYGEEYIGSIDFAINAGSVQGVGRGSGTLGEIKIAQSEASKIANLDFITFNEGISRLYKMVFQVLKERIGESLFIEGKNITKSDFSFPSEVKSNGSLEESDSQVKVNKSLTRMQIINQQPPDFVTIEDRYNAYLDYLEADGVKDIDKYSSNPEQILQERLVQLQQQNQQLAGQNQLMLQSLDKSEKDLSKVQEKQRQAENKFKGKVEAKVETAKNLRETLLKGRK